MDLNVRKYNETYIIDISGEIDFYNSHEIRLLFSKMLSKDIRSFIINLENVEYIDSAGIGVLIFICEKIAKANFQLAITSVHGMVKNVIELTKLGSYFPIVNTVEEAILKFQNETVFV